MSDDRVRIDVPPGLAERIEAHFGDSSNTEAGKHTTALFYACERYEAERGIDWESQPAHDEVDEEE